MILVDPNLSENEFYLDKSEALLIEFVKEFESLYTRNYLTYNVHNLLHIVDDVRRFGRLDLVSAFRFENLIGKLKKVVKSGNKPLEQIANRLAERKKFEAIPKYINTEIMLQKIHEKGPLISNDVNISQYSMLSRGLLKLNVLDGKNNRILLNDGNYVECFNFILNSTTNMMFIVGRHFKILSALYKKPIDSKNLNIVVAKKTNKPLELYSCELIAMKVCMIPILEYFVLSPMGHTAVG